MEKILVLDAGSPQSRALVKFIKKYGDFTIVGAGSVVTKSFPNGYCVIGGNPAKLIKKLEPEKCIRYKYKYEYYGYYSKNKFERKYKQIHLEANYER